MQRLKQTLLSLFVLLLLLVSGCAAPAPTTGGTGAESDDMSSTEPQSGGSLTVALNGEIDTIDPHLSVTIVGFQVYPMVYEGLVKLNPAMDDVEPLLAASWEQPDDVTYIFKLQEGVTFHDGSDFTAEDVVFTYDRVMDEEVGSSRRPDFLPVASVEAIDDYTVQFTMSDPFAPFLTKLENLRIVPSDSDTDHALNPIGTGPFTFVEWISGQNITLAKNSGYWQDGLPYLDELVYRPIPEPSTRVVELQTGNVDLLNEVPQKDVASLEDSGAVQVFRVMGVVRDHVGFNMESDLFKDNINLRKAIGWAIDRQTIADAIMFGLAVPSQVAIPTNHWGFNPAVDDSFGYDIDKAKELLAQADPVPETISIKVSPTYPNQIKMAELMQQDMAKLGIDLEIIQLEWSNWIQEVVTDGNFDMEIVLISGGSDPDDFFYQWHHTGEVFNLWRYSDPEMDDLLESGRSTTDQSMRQETYHAIQEKLIEDAPLVHIIYRESVMAASDAVQNFTMTGRYDMDFREVWVNR